jgi:hypothetical protein
MIAKNLRFLPRNTSDFSPSAIALREYKRIKGKSLKHIILDRFLNQYGYDKGAVTASAIIDDLLALTRAVLPVQRQLISEARTDRLARRPPRRVPQEGEVYGPNQT